MISEHFVSGMSAYEYIAMVFPTVPEIVTTLHTPLSWMINAGRPSKVLITTDKHGLPNVQQRTRTSDSLA